MRGKFITIEGVEGSGKTTQIQYIARYLTEKNIPHIITREPGGTALGRKIRELLLNPTYPVVPEAEILLYLADRAQHVGEKIIPHLDKGVWVISDRYFDSTLAYQGYGRGFDLNLLKSFIAFATKGLIPDLTILIDLPPAVGLSRVKSRGEYDRLERETVEFHQRVREGFLQLAKDQRFRVVDGRKNPEEIFLEIKGFLEGLNG
ncbi:dTMP kinase [Carboxydothermus islandicus]|uniref:Thymidylate kinase n=1 Tax=Carboxydothermus islandicus TaxID=661089 RepID=A0A1L8D1V5_9THEO|nr:dTMP kinase [Carboxydothermus islandicus]GAV25175.1 dTMP kinase [Carboxydothermus islandicus]